MASRGGAEDRRPRRRRVRWWGVLLAVVAAMVAGEAGARIVGPNIDRASGSEERAYIKADQIYRRGPGRTDVAVLGSSETAGGLVPATFMAEVPALDGGYNAALAGARLDLDREWAERIVLPGLDPAVVVIGMLPTATADLSGVAHDPAADTGPAYRSAIELIDPGGLGSLGWKLRQRSALVRYRPFLRRPSTLVDAVGATLSGGRDGGDARPGARMDWETESDPEQVLVNTRADGAVLDYRAPSLPGEDGLTVAAFNAAGQLPHDHRDLEDLVEAIRDHGAVPVIAVAPVDRSVLEAGGVEFDTLDGRVDELEAWAEDNDVPIHEEFTADYPPTDFHDRYHVSGGGAERWSRRVGRWLADLCDAGDLGSAC